MLHNTDAKNSVFEVLTNRNFITNVCLKRISKTSVGQLQSVLGMHW